MKPWLAAALLFLLAVPYQTFWYDSETARRGVLAICAGVLCLWPGVLPRRVPRAALGVGALALWALLRSVAVTNPGYALEAAAHLFALALLVCAGNGSTVAAVLRATLPVAIVVALVGIAQGFGWTLVPDTTEAVSTLGNRNVASEVLAVCGAAAALAVCREDHQRWPRAVAMVALVLCALAVAWNGSRSGLIALPVACLPCLWFPRRLLVLGAVVLGLGVGLLVAPPVGARDEAAPVAVAETPGRAVATPSTIAVRLEIWRGTLAMAGDRWLVGHGGGQFQVEYPLFRTAEEIELSSFGRRFQTATKTAHNDYLQVLADFGVVGFLLAALAAWLILRRVPWRCSGPLLAFLLLALVRSPLGNAPAAAVVCLFAGALLGREGPPFTVFRHRFQAVGLAAFLLWFGGGQLLAQMAATGYVEQMRTKSDWSAALRSIEWALWFRPHDHDMRIERLKDRLKRQETLPLARADLEYLLRRAPRLPVVQIHQAELLNAEGHPTAALEVLNHVRARDMENQRAIQVSVVILVRQRKADAAVEVLYRSRHPRTREPLARILGGLAGEAKTDRDRDLLQGEQAFVEFLDLAEAYLAAGPGRNAAQRLGDLRAMQKLAARFKQLQDRVPGAENDLRYSLMLALLAVEQGAGDGAAALADRAGRRTLSPTHRVMMERLFTPLRAIPAWRERLAKL